MYVSQIAGVKLQFQRKKLTRICHSVIASLNGLHILGKNLDLRNNTSSISFQFLP